MSNRNWTKHKRRERMARNGTEERDTGANLPPVAGTRRAPVVSKEELRRQADRLLAGYSGPVTKVPAGIRVTGSQATGEIPQLGKTVRSKRKVGRNSPAGRKSKPYRRQADLFGAAKSVRNPAHIDRAVPPGLVIYCDGACEPNPGAGGWGFVVYRDGKEIHADCGGSNPTTNNIMELTGALRAMEWIEENAAGMTVRLFCDSQYVVKGCNEWRHGWKRKGWQRGGSSAKPENRTIANLDLWQTLDRALTRTPIELEWCKGHAGIIGNERADELSLEGRESILALQPDPLDLIRDQLDYSARGGW